MTTDERECSNMTRNWEPRKQQRVYSCGGHHVSIGIEWTTSKRL